MAAETSIAAAAARRISLQRIVPRVCAHASNARCRLRLYSHSRNRALAILARPRLGLLLAHMHKPRARGFRQISVASPSECNAPSAFRLVQQHVPRRTMRSRFREHARKKGDADTSGHQLEDEIDLTAARRDLRLEALFPAGVEDHLVERETLLEQDERRVRKSYESDRLPVRERVIPRQQSDQGFAAHVLPIEIPGYRVHQGGEVDLSRAKDVFQALAVMHRHVHVDARITTSE